MKTNVFRIVLRCIFLLILIIFTQDLSAQFSFSDVTGAPVLSHGVNGEWDDRQVWYPSVIKDGDTLRMYYTGGYDIVWEDPMTKIGYAWSLDGINWTRYIGNPVLLAEYNWEEDYLAGCAVIKDSDTMRMWYGCGYPGPSIGYATSIDGRNWNKHSNPVLSSGPVSEWDDAIIKPTTVIKDDDLFKLWYWAGRPGFPAEQSMPQTGMATSPDGINWTKYDDPATTEAPFAYSDPVLKHGLANEWDEDRAIFPMVLKKGSGYEMWYTGARWGFQQNMGYAQSDDGINWIKHPARVFTSPGSWGDTPYGGTVLAIDSSYHLWYALFHTDVEAGPKIGYARSTNSSGVISQIMEINFQLYPNPFISATTLSYTLDKPSTVTISIFNPQGQLIEKIEQEQPKGEQKVQWNAEGLPAGMYYFRIQAGDKAGGGKMVKME